MSTAGTTNPGRMWISSKPPTFTAQSFDFKKSGSLEDTNDTNNPSLLAKYDPERPGGKIFSERTFNTYKKKQRPGILRVENGVSKPPVRFKDNETEGKEKLTTKAGGVSFTTTKSYEALIAERDALFESEGAYRRRAEQLEEENARILLDYDSIYKENNILRDKLDRGEDTHIESYQRVYDDRKILREAETAYKRRINQLEHDAKEMLKNFESLYTENKVLRDKASKLEDRLNSIDRLDDVKKIHQLEKNVKLLEKTVRTLGYEREDLVKENHEIENQMYKLREEISDLNKRNLLLEKENEGFKRGFMALGKTIENNWKDDVKHKTRRQEEEDRKLREEHAQLKINLEAAGKKMHELEKLNVELKTRNDILEQDKRGYDQRLLDLAKETNKRTPSAVKERNAELERLKQQKLDEMQEKLDHLLADNTELKTVNAIMIKEKATFEDRLREASKQPRETASSIRRKMEAEREIRDLNMHLDNFKEKVKKAEVEKVELQKELQKLEVEIKANKQASKAFASDKAKETGTHLKELNDKIISLNAEIRSLTEENLKLQANYNQMKDKLERQIDVLTKENETMRQEKATLETSVKETNNTSNNKITELQDELNSVQVELQLLKSNQENTKSALEEYKTENKNLVHKLETKTNELDNLKETIRTNRDVYLELTKAQRENVNLRKDIEDLNSKIKTDSLKQDAELEELLKNQEFMNSALAEHKIRLDMIQSEKNDLKNDNLKLVKANERQAKTIADLELDIKTMTGDSSSKMNNLKDELGSLQKDLQRTEKELIEAKQEIEISKNERENHIKKLMTQMDKLKQEREKETQQLKDQSESLRAEIARLKIFEERIGSMEVNLQELVHKLNESEEKNKQMTRDKLSNLQQVVSEMKSENLANRIRAAEREQNELEKHRLELEIKQDAINEIRKLKEENSRLLGLLEDKRAAEEAKDEWTKKKNKFGEIVAQNKRLQEENKRVLELFENSHSENLKKELQAKAEKLNFIESKFQQYFTENEKLRKALEEKEVEMKKVGSKADRSNRLQHENNKLKAEIQKLREDGAKKDHQIAALRELEITKAKYIDSTANNQRLYEENMRLRETIDKSKDYKLELQKLRNEEKLTATQQARFIEENTLLKNTLQMKETELRREIELQKDRASNLQTRNVRLMDELAKMKADLSKKDDLILKLRALETASGKLKDASINANRLYEENQRLRNLLENVGWKSNFQKAKLLSTDTYKEHPKAVATYVETNPNTDTKGKLVSNY